MRSNLWYGYERILVIIVGGWSSTTAFAFSALSLGFSGRFLDIAAAYVQDYVSMNKITNIASETASQTQAAVDRAVAMGTAPLHGEPSASPDEEGRHTKIEGTIVGGTDVVYISYISF